jgi:glycerol transport system ATP-binding protein
MAQIRLDHVGHTYVAGASEEDYALKPIDLTWQDGGTYALLGPSGCGKTTMLNIISGLVAPSEGRVWFDDRDMTLVRTARRNIAQVFQFPVTYASMTVYENLAFPLVCRKWPRERIRSKVGEIANLLDLGGKLNKAARSLSADEKQLISLGRGLVRDDVSALLMDEPLTVIDPQLKFHLRRKLKEINERFGLTVIYVTHDQNEAMTFAGRVLVMSEGRVVQSGTPEELFEYPQTIYVGQFIGAPAMNFFDAKIGAGGLSIAGVPLGTSYRVDVLPQDGVRLGLRPEYLEFVSGKANNVLPVTVTDVQDHGSVRVVGVAIGEARAKVKLAREKPVPQGEAWMRLPAEKIRLYVGGELLRT